MGRLRQRIVYEDAPAKIAAAFAALGNERDEILYSKTEFGGIEKAEGVSHPASLHWHLRSIFEKRHSDIIFLRDGSFHISSIRLATVLKAAGHDGVGMLNECFV